MNKTQGGPLSEPNVGQDRFNRSPMMRLPCYRTIVAIDIEGSTNRINSMKARLRWSMYELFAQALLAGGVTDQHRDPLVDRGDGIFALVHPSDDVPKTVILSTVIPTLSRLLAAHMVGHPDENLRMRAAVHAGEVHHDAEGCYGEALDLTFRLLDANPVRKELRRTTGSLVLVVSDHIYQTVVRHDYAGIDKQFYKPAGSVQIAHQRQRGWLHTPVASGIHQTGPAEQQGGTSAQIKPFLRQLA